MNLTHFSPDSDPALFNCPCGECHVGPSPDLLSRLDDAREFAQVPFHVTSGPRCPEYNTRIGGSKFSEHMDGDAADISAVGSRARYRIIMGAVEAGFNRIGIGKDFVHLGVSDSNDQDVIWTYY